MPPAFIPPFLGGTTGLMYPYTAVPPMAAGPSFPVQTEPSRTNGLPCTECNERFSTLQELAIHIRNASHFPGGSKLPRGGGSRSAVKIPERPTPDAQLGQEMKANDSSVVEVTRTEVVREKTGDNLSCDVPPKQSGFDFIRRLESTIQSAISKVEVSQSGHTRNGLSCPSKFNPFTTASLQSDKKSDSKTPKTGGFSPFFSAAESSSRRAENGASGITCYAAAKGPGNLEGIGTQRRDMTKATKSPERESTELETKSCSDDRSRGRSHSTADGGQKTGPGESVSPAVVAAKRRSSMVDELPSKSRKTHEGHETPLDLTVKKEDTEAPSPRHGDRKSPERATEFEEAKPSANVFSAYAAGKSAPSPLQSLTSNVQSLFSFMRPKIETALGVSSRPARASNEYKPLRDQGAVFDSNPLQEMLKIVHNTQPMDRAAAPDERSRRASDVSDVASDAKKAKTSLLNDLVVPEDGMSTVNPLRQMQDLVDNKLTDNRQLNHTRPRGTSSADAINALMTSLCKSSAPVASSTATCCSSAVSKHCVASAASLPFATSSSLATSTSFAKDAVSSPLTSLSSLVSSAVFPSVPTASSDKEPYAGSCSNGIRSPPRRTEAAPCPDRERKPRPFCPNVSSAVNGVSSDMDVEKSGETDKRVNSFCVLIPLLLLCYFWQKRTIFNCWKLN